MHKSENKMVTVQNISAVRSTVNLMYKAKLLIWQRALPLALHFRSHRRLLAALNTERFASLIQNHPKIKYKYLRGNYLSQSLKVRDALEILQYHYICLERKISDNFFTRLFDEFPVIWESVVGEQHYRIRMAFPRNLHRPYRVVDHEGDLLLLFEADDQTLYVMCATIVPGELARNCWNAASADRAIFVGKIQGMKGTHETMRAATKALHDVAPPRMLLCAIEALARIFHADTIVGVSNKEQISKNNSDYESSIYFDYDTFWTSIGAHETDKNAFFLDSSLPEKSIELVQQKHRSRTLAKRRFRKGIVDAIEENLNRDLLSGAAAPQAAAAIPAEAMA
ncbi:DUF535 family protein [Duganella sp. HH105]|uniref:DUF535 family protein n=1 Tax=Duganella sp. HH105 TaxID=1781067 RepID=UPI0009FFE9D2|nr:DUF535 family protein [Duganella sp. HH105]